MTERHEILSVHKFRRSARREERIVQKLLSGDYPVSGGVRVEKAGPFQWAVVLTENKGH